MAAVVLVILAVYRVAWVSDDALITLRTTLNISHGWGPGFNATESVQAYTHPLWFLLWLGIGAVTGQWIVGIIVMSLLFTGAAVATAVWQTNSLPVLALISGGLSFSNAFVEYATSGLEGSLGYLLVAVAFLLVSSATSGKHKSEFQEKFLEPFALGVVAAGLFLTRMDFAVLLVPPTVFLLITWRKCFNRLLIAGAAFTLPVSIWFLYTYTTYGTWLPNTFTAKRNVEIPAVDLIFQGLSYLFVSARFDLVTGIFILSAIIWSLIGGTWMQKSWALGVVAYLSYVVWVGGDFMVGRFLAVPMFVAVLILTSLFQENFGEKKRQDIRTGWLITGGAAATIGFLAYASYLTGGGPVSLTATNSERWKYVDQNGVADERGFYVDEAQREFSNITSNLNKPFELHDFIAPVGAEFAKSGLRDIDHLTKIWPRNDGERLIVPTDAAIVCGLTGSWGIVTGPTVHLIDVCGLTDRFIAMQTFTSPDGNWRPGHFERRIPDGYEQAIREGDSRKVVSPELSRQLSDLWGTIK